MLYNLNQEVLRSFVALVLVTITIGNCCLRVQGYLDGPLQLFDYSHVLAKEVNSQMHKRANVFGDDVKKPLLWHRDEPDRFSSYLNVSQHRGELCNRVCIKGQTRVCYFEFTLELYQVMGVACGRCAQGVEEDCNRPQCIVADGIEKGVMSINRQIPGPAIQVCENDFIIVDVHNGAHGSAAAIHWHGVHMKETPYMDGVPLLTQCPISHGSSFRYHFYATEPGTHFYHSHSGHHKANGQYGALIIRRPNEPLAELYDYDLPEHHILLTDWTQAYAETHFPGLPSTLTYPDSFLINSRGVFKNLTTGEQTKVRPTIYYVTPGKRYRFRLINSANHFCQFQLQIERHRVAVIASDSYDVSPHLADTLVSNAGERYDFILKANQRRGDFWIRVRGLGLCTDRLLESYALLRYRTTRTFYREYNVPIPPYPKYEQPYPNGIYFNHPNATCKDGERMPCVTHLAALESDDDLLYSKPDHKFFLAFQNQPVPNKEIFQPGQYNTFFNIDSNRTVVGSINKISLKFPDFPPLTQPDLIDESKFCDESNKPAMCSDRTVCYCIHRLKVKLNSIVELIIVDETEARDDVSHPFHLHGYRFMVTGLGKHPEGLHMTVSRAKIMEQNNRLPRDHIDDRPPFKDTVSIPYRGYAIVRFRATNPGFWLMHCHFEFHFISGMGLIMQVGETSQMVKPPSGFPKCGNYLPSFQSPLTNFHHYTKRC